MIRAINSTEYGQLVEMLEAAGLPAEDVASANWFALLGVFKEQRLVAAAGLEQWTEHLLLRSVVTAESFRGGGLAGQLVTALHQQAIAAEKYHCWLLTLDADDYFADRHGYQPVDRSGAPESISNSTQFSGLCPDNATLMFNMLK